MGKRRGTKKIVKKSSTKKAPARESVVRRGERRPQKSGTSSTGPRIIKRGK